MAYLVAYDITEPKRLRRVCRILEGFGTRLQYSVFWCDIETPTMLNLWNILLHFISEAEDKLAAYPIDARARAQAFRAGTPPDTDLGEDDFFIIA